MNRMLVAFEQLRSLCPLCSEGRPCHDARCKVVNYHIRKLTSILPPVEGIAAGLELLAQMPKGSVVAVAEVEMTAECDHKRLPDGTCKYCHAPLGEEPSEPKAAMLGMPWTGEKSRPPCPQCGNLGGYWDDGRCRRCTDREEQVMWWWECERWGSWRRSKSIPDDFSSAWSAAFRMERERKVVSAWFRYRLRCGEIVTATLGPEVEGIRGVVYADGSKGELRVRA